MLNEYDIMSIACSCDVAYEEMIGDKHGKEEKRRSTEFRGNIVQMP